MKLINFDNCEYSIWHGTYTGNAGDKDGIIYNNENWIIKYPKTTKDYKGENLNPYTTSPLSEYIGSHIYKILEFDVHETMLGIKEGKLVVACKDFKSENDILLEMRSLKNSAARQLKNTKDVDLPSSATGDNVNLDELLLHFKMNPFLNDKQIKDKAIERFWECAIVDVFINNNDRNNGNWGLLKNQKTNELKLAPVFDNGNSFYNKHNNEKFGNLLNNNNNNIRFSILGNGTAYSVNEHRLSVNKLLSLDNEDLRRAIINVVPNINEKIDEIIEFINNIPEVIDEYQIIMPNQKKYYTKVLEITAKEILEPKYKELIKSEKIDKDINQKKTKNKQYANIKRDAVKDNAGLGNTNIGDTPPKR